MLSFPQSAQALANSFANGCEEFNAAFSASVEAATKSSSAAWQGLETLTRTMGGMMQESYARVVSAGKSIVSAQSPQEASDTHQEFLKDCFDGFVAGSGKLSEISLHVAKTVFDPLAQHAHDAFGAVARKVTRE